MNRTMTNIFDAMDAVGTGMNETALEFVDEYYNSGCEYIHDAIMEFADSHASIYYKGIIQFLSNHVDEVNETIKEFGWEGVGEDLYKAVQMTEFRLAEEELYENMTDILTLSALKQLEDLGVTKIDDELLDDILDEVHDLSEDNVFEDIEDIIKRFVKVA